MACSSKIDCCAEKIRLRDADARSRLDAEAPTEVCESGRFSPAEYEGIDSPGEDGVRGKQVSRTLSILSTSWRFCILSSNTNSSVYLVYGNAVLTPRFIMKSDADSAFGLGFSV